MHKLVDWFAANTVAANLLMVLILLSGGLAVVGIKQEVFPEFSADVISVSVPYLGAAPEEVEEGVCVRIEEQIQSLEGIKKITSTASEGVGTVSIEVEPGKDVRELLDDVKNRVDAIDTFPEETEKPIVQEVVIRRRVFVVAVSGQAEESVLRSVAERVRDDLTALEGITQVELAAARPYEVSIEVSEDALRRYGLTFDFVAEAVRRSSLDLPGGSVRTASGEILLRTKGQAYRGGEFEELVLVTRPDGTYLRLGDIARVVDGFAETDQSARFDSMPSVLVHVFRVGDQRAIGIAQSVRDYIAREQFRLPEGIRLETAYDDTKILESRLDLLLRSGRAGLLLVLIILTLFLRLRLAFWVSLGLPVSFLGTFWLMPSLDVSVNLISLFAFIVVLGILVDDAIVVGEGVFSAQQKGLPGLQAATFGARRVAVPVVFGVLTTVAAFTPLTMVEGAIGKVMRVIPLVVIPCLLFSLVESLLILPAHLSHFDPEKEKRKKRGLVLAWTRFQGFFADGLVWFSQRVYGPILEFGLKFRYLSVAVGVATLMLTLGMVIGGRVNFVFMHDVEADNVIAYLTMPQGTTVEVTSAAVKRLEQAALETARELEGPERRDRAQGRSAAVGLQASSVGDDPQSTSAPVLRSDGLFRHILTTIGDQPSRNQGGPGGGDDSGSVSGAHRAEVNIELAPSEERTYSSTEVANLWREKAGGIPDAVELTYTSSLFTPGEPINIRLTSPDLDQLQEAADQLKGRLSEYPGVYDIADSYRVGKQEIKLRIKPEAETLGLTLADLARQVRQAFFGEEAQRIQRGRDEVKVMVRYPYERRQSLADLERMRIRTPSGSEVPFSQVAEAEYGRGYASIRRVDRQRSINVTANVDEARSSTVDILADLTNDFLPVLMQERSGVRYALEGRQREQQETLEGLGSGYLLALVAIFSLLAIPLRSYLQPLIIMSAIPFGLVGAIWGHILMGMDLTILSGFGVVALAGVVVNDSLVLVDFINKRRSEGLGIVEATRQAGIVRFRPIVLTSLTTFGGLTPLLLEKSLQAQFLIPMAVSLAFGVVFSTFVILILVPAGYLILDDLQSIPRLLSGRSREAAQAH